MVMQHCKRSLAVVENLTHSNFALSCSDLAFLANDFDTLAFTGHSHIQYIMGTYPNAVRASADKKIVANNNKHMLALYQ
jgi:hypothetical protein